MNGVSPYTSYASPMRQQVLFSAAREKDKEKYFKDAKKEHGEEAAAFKKKTKGGPLSALTSLTTKKSDPEKAAAANAKANRRQGLSYNA